MYARTTDEKKYSSSKKEEKSQPRQSLIQLAKCDENRLDDVLKFCHNESKPDFDHLASELTSTNVGVLFRVQEIRMEYKTNLADSKAEVENEEWLGFSAEHFLPIRIRMLLEHVVRFEKSLHAALNPEEQRKSAALKQEILIAIETFRIILFKTVIRRYTATDQRACSYRILAAEIAYRAFSLEDGKVMVVSSGWIEHAVYLTLIKHADHVYVSVSNFGEKSGSHFPSNHRYFKNEPLHPVFILYGQSRCRPRIVGKVVLSEIEKLISYLDEVLQVEKLSADEAVPKLYNFMHVLPHPGDIPFANSAFLKQIIGNCVTYGYSIGMRLRLMPYFDIAELNHMFADEKKICAVPPEKQATNLAAFNFLQRETFLKTEYVLDDFNNLLSLILIKTKYYEDDTEPFDDIDLYLLSRRLTSSQTTHVGSIITAAAEHLHRLTELDLTHAHIADSEIELLVRLLPFFSNLTRLSLACNAISNRGALALSGVLKRLPALTTLNISHNRVENDGVIALVDALLESNVKHFFCDANPYQADGQTALQFLQRILERRISPAVERKTTHTEARKTKTDKEHKHATHDFFKRSKRKYERIAEESQNVTPSKRLRTITA